MNPACIQTRPCRQSCLDWGEGDRRSGSFEGDSPARESVRVTGVTGRVTDSVAVSHRGHRDPVGSRRRGLRGEGGGRREWRDGDESRRERERDRRRAYRTLCTQRTEGASHGVTLDPPYVGEGREGDEDSLRGEGSRRGLSVATRVWRKERRALGSAYALYAMRRRLQGSRPACIIPGGTHSEAQCRCVRRQAQDGGLGVSRGIRCGCRVMYRQLRGRVYEWG